MRIEAVAGAVGAQFGDVKDGVNAEGRWEVQFVSKGGDFAFDGEWTDPALRKLG